MLPTNRDLAGSRPWCIAGGYAACPYLATDMDVWLLGYPKEILENVRAGLLKMHPDIIPEDNPSVVAMLDPENPRYVGAHPTLKVGHLADACARHILVTSAPTVHDLLAGFDVSTHQCAVNSNGTWIIGANWTPIWEPPHAIRWNENTGARMDKIAARYKHIRCATLAKSDPAWK